MILFERVRQLRQPFSREVQIVRRQHPGGRHLLARFGQRRDGARPRLAEQLLAPPELLQEEGGDAPQPVRLVVARRGSHVGEALHGAQAEAAELRQEELHLRR